jgi:DHA2 family multidrug resistance protein
MLTEAEPMERINWSAIIVVIIGTFMAILDSSIVNVAIPKMMTVLAASQDSVQWIITGYMLALGVIMPLSGFLGDTFGYKRVMIIALALFVAGSTLCGMAWSLNSMVAARVIQALGGGMMQPLGMAMLYMNCPRSKIGMVMGVWGIAAMCAPAIGPALGGYLVEYVNWRMIFYINVPIGIVNIILAIKYLKETALIKGKNLDKWGIVFSSSLFFCLLMAISKGNSKGWTSPFIVGLLAVSFLSLVIFIFVELHHPEPILDLRLFKNRVFTISMIITAVICVGMFGGIYLIPIYIQNVLGHTAMKSGLLTLPAALASGIMMPISGRIFDRYGPRAVSIVGLLLVTITTYLMRVVDLMTPLLLLCTWFTFRGLGMGLCNMPIATAGMNTVPPPKIGRASSLSNVIRQVSSSFGIALLTNIMQDRRAFHFAQLAQSLNMQSDQALAMQSGLGSLAVSQGMSSSAVQTLTLQNIVAKITLMASASAIGDCFLITAVLTFLAIGLCPFLVDNRPGQLIKPLAKPGLSPAPGD